jgi:DNA-directed RNA polymerase subunit RPC12/RpoP
LNRSCMKKADEKRCEYLAKDNLSCTAVDETEGKAARSEGCSADPKDMCCYLCDKRETCEMGCSYLDEEDKGQTKSSVSSVGGVEKVFLCPFCGAPYKKLIAAETVEVKCDYCGAQVMVPPNLGGAVKQCPNHADVLATGICNDCGESFCSRCLFVYDDRGSRLYLCSKCYENRRTSQKVGYFIVGAISIVMVVFALVFSRSERISSPEGFYLLGFLGVGLLLVAYASWRWFLKQKPTSVYDMHRSNPEENGLDRNPP